jgi:anti-sigma factor RsiW
MESPFCRWVRANLPAYLDGELKASTASAVRRHMKRCPACAARARLLADSWEVLDEDVPPPVRSGFTGRMMERVAREKELIPLQARARARRRLRRILSGVSGVAAGLVVGFGLYAWSGFEAAPTSPIEREVSRSLTFLEDVDLLDEIATVEVIDQLLAEKAPVKDTPRG